MVTCSCSHIVHQLREFLSHQMSQTDFLFLPQTVSLNSVHESPATCDTQFAQSPLGTWRCPSSIVILCFVEKMLDRCPDGLFCLWIWAGFIGCVIGMTKLIVMAENPLEKVNHVTFDWWGENIFTSYKFMFESFSIESFISI